MCEQFFQHQFSRPLIKSVIFLDSACTVSSVVNEAHLSAVPVRKFPDIDFMTKMKADAPRTTSIEDGQQSLFLDVSCYFITSMSPRLITTLLPPGVQAFDTSCDCAHLPMWECVSGL